MAAPHADVEAVRKDVHEHDECPKDTLYDDSTAVVDHAAERSLCWKFDIRILPVLAVMCKCLFPPQKRAFNIDIGKHCC